MSRPFVIKWLILSALIIVICLVQNTVTCRLFIWGVTPVLMPVAVACFALYLGAEGGGAFGLTAGVVWHLIQPGMGVWHILILTCMGIAVGVACKYVFNQSMPSAVLWSFLTLAASQGLVFVFYIMIGRVPPEAARTVLLPEIAYSMIFSPFLYWLAKAVDKKIGVYI